MILLRLDLEGNKGATIERLDTESEIYQIIRARYNHDVATNYAQDVSTFIRDNMTFPEDGIYKLDNDGMFLIFDIESKKWKTSKTGKGDYLIDESSDFWEKFDQEFGYLEEFRMEIRKMIKKKTQEMFEKEPGDINYIENRNGSFIAQSKTDYSIAAVFEEYLDEKNVENFIQKFLKGVYGTDEYPIWVINNGIVDAAITHNTILYSKNLDDFMPFLQKYFSPEDAEQICIRLKNILVFGKDQRYHPIVELDSDGDPIYMFCGFYVKDYTKRWVVRPGVLDYSLQIKIIQIRPENMNRLVELIRNDNSDFSCGTLKFCDETEDEICSFEIHYNRDDDRRITYSERDSTISITDVICAQTKNGKITQIPVQFKSKSVTIATENGKKQFDITKGIPIKVLY